MCQELLALLEKTKQKSPVLEFILIRYAKCWERRRPGESCWSDSGNGDSILVFNLSTILLGHSKGMNSERTYYACAAAEIMYAIMLRILCKAQDLLSLHSDTVHTGRISGIVWILEMLNAWQVLGISSRIMEGAARYKLLLPLDGICLTS